jgi:hypothetical protein
MENEASSFALVHDLDAKLVLGPSAVSEQIDDDAVVLPVSEVISGRHGSSFGSPRTRAGSYRR